jgi:CheY-like chemotaxis protein
MLLVDDDGLIRELYRKKFEEAGFQVTLADGAETALMDLRNGLRPDCIVLDLLMPGMDGFSFLQELKKMEKIGNPIVIVLSSEAQETEKERAHALGANAYLVKSDASPSDIINEVKAILETQSVLADGKEEASAA